jgi:hypothetical protein
MDINTLARAVRANVPDWTFQVGVRFSSLRTSPLNALGRRACGRRRMTARAASST